MLATKAPTPKKKAKAINYPETNRQVQKVKTPLRLGLSFSNSDRNIDGSPLT
jgi:hypothetical protein